MNRKKSIFLSLAIIGVAATMITAATSAVFTDQVVSTSNQMTAGTLFLSVDGNCGTGDSPTARTDGSGGAGGGTACADSFTWTETVTNMKIGDTASHTFTIVNDGSLAGTLTATPTFSAETPADCFSFTTTTLGSGSLAASNGGTTDETTYALVVTLDASGAVDPPLDNDCQAATATVEVTFNLVQS